MMRAVFLILVAMLVPACGGSSSSAPASGPTELLDQDPMLMGPNPSVVNSSIDKGQTFTVGIEGLLSRIELMLYETSPAGPLLIDIRQTTGGVPVEADTPVLASVTVQPGELPTSTGVYTSFDISSFGIQVTPGQVLAICLRSPGSPATFSYTWPTEVVAYAGGQGQLRDLSAMTPMWAPSNGVAAFRTYVQP